MAEPGPEARWSSVPAAVSQTQSGSLELVFGIVDNSGGFKDHLFCLSPFMEKQTKVLRKEGTCL